VPALDTASDAASNAAAATGRPFVVNVVLTWNDVDMASACLASLRNVDYAPMTTVLVDNGSSFPCIEPLTEAFPEIVPVPLDRNYGFTGGCNRGLEKALELGADYVFLLNNDTVIHKDAVTELVRAFEENPDAGMISALILDLGDEKIIQSYTAFVNRGRARIERPTELKEWTPDYAKTSRPSIAPPAPSRFAATRSGGSACSTNRSSPIGKTTTCACASPTRATR